MGFLPKLSPGSAAELLGVCIIDKEGGEMKRKRTVGEISHGFSFTNQLSPTGRGSSGDLLAKSQSPSYCPGVGARGYKLLVHYLLQHCRLTLLLPDVIVAIILASL